eukprot:scaffold133522_cov14-Tisochrysis_lutea.AAC.1
MQAMTTFPTSIEEGVQLGKHSSASMGNSCAWQGMAAVWQARQELGRHSAHAKHDVAVICRACA